MKKIFFLLISLSLLQNIEAQSLSQLGQRDPSCTQETPDDYELKIPESLKSETLALSTNDKLKQLIVPSPNCFRVGTESKILLANTEIGLLGRGFITNITILSKSELAQKKVDYSAKAISDFMKENPSAKYSILSIDLSEKVAETFVNSQYKRLPTCFPTYEDWEAYPLPEKSGLALAKKIQSGQIKAQISNGTFNCYKVGVSAEIIDATGKPNNYGSIMPKELYLVHHTKLNEKHAQLLGENLEALKKRISENTDKDGGYTNILVFEYLPPLPADLINDKKNSR